MKIFTAILTLCACTLSAAVPKNDLSSGIVAREIQELHQGYDGTGDDVGPWSKRGLGHRRLRKRQYVYNNKQHKWVYAPTASTTIITGSNGGAPYLLDKQRAREDAARNVNGIPGQKKKGPDDSLLWITRQQQGQTQDD